MEFSPGWRDALFAAVVILAIYIGYILLRLSRPRRRAPLPAAADTPAPETQLPPAPPTLIPPEHADAPAAQSAASSAPPEPTALRGVQTELVGLRAQMDALQHEVDTLRDEVERLKAARAVSPQYNDALSLAQKGMDAAGIAEKCGISIGEAELVCALARTQAEGGA